MQDLEACLLLAEGLFKKYKGDGRWPGVERGWVMRF